MSVLKWLAIFFLLLPLNVFSQLILINEMPHGIYYERTARITNFWEMKDFRDVFHYDKFLLGKNIISGNISYNTGRVILDNGITKSTEWRSAMSFFTRIRILEEVFFTSTFYKDFNPKANPGWVSDYGYSLGRYNWRPRKINFGYENYVNNKYSDTGKERWSKFLQGYYYMSIGTPLRTRTRLDSILSIGASAYARYAIRYLDDQEVERGSLLHGKPTFGASVRYAFQKVIKGFYVEFTPMIYLSKKHKQPWDPDYTYGFGYFDWRSFRISLTYGNYAINRYPWNEQKFPDHGFLDGNFKVTANWMW